MKSAVLIIDVQKGLFDTQPGPFESEEVIEQINTVTSWARSNQYPVIYVQHELDDSVLEYGSDGWQLQSDLVTEDGDLFIRKTTPDSFLRTDLAMVLEHQNIDHLIVCGYASEFCVDTTVRKAAALGYQVDIVSDAHTTHDKEHASGEQIRTHHNVTLPNITSFGVAISAVSATDIVNR
ncbi:cysteine hydrolase family protein [Vibrio salinus]|uniref:cysteine hydrolase family protein n=1 Tax=Vibrio salinus TaxID=2899784 RepID=UPI001E59D035|nr:cysteine hydrolase family protein [Vibrio salinus]MCE0494266.1 cysteine hydrolase [Vibrio salinus]